MKIADYNNSIVNLSNSILKKFNVNPFHSTIKEIDDLIKNKEKIIVFLFDGMGKAILEKHLNEKSFFRRHIVKNITSTTPPTTVASTTGFLSAKYPIETGWLGWTLYFKDLDKNINVFPNVDDDTGEKLAGENVMRSLKNYEDIASLINKNNKQECAKIIMGYPVDNNPKVKTLNKFVKYSFDEIKKENQKFFYSYWVNPDGLMHKYGTKNFRVHFNIKHIQHLIKKYAKKNKDVGVIVIADHGMIDTTFMSLKEHEDLSSLLIRSPSIEKRTMNLFVKEGKQDLFKELFNKYYGEYYSLFTKEEALDKGIFGDTKDVNNSLEFLGDFIAIANGDISLEYPNEKSKKKRFKFKAHHAGGTEDESLISVIAINF